MERHEASGGLDTDEVGAHAHAHAAAAAAQTSGERGSMAGGNNSQGIASYMCQAHGRQAQHGAPNCPAMGGPCVRGQESVLPARTGPIIRPAIEGKQLREEMSRGQAGRQTNAPMEGQLGRAGAGEKDGSMRRRS